MYYTIINVTETFYILGKIYAINNGENNPKMYLGISRVWILFNNRFGSL